MFNVIRRISDISSSFYGRETILSTHLLNKEAEDKVDKLNKLDADHKFVKA